MAKSVASSAEGASYRDRAVFRDRPLTGSSEGRIGERLVRGFLFLCAALSVATTAGIIFVLIFETLEFFREVSLWEFYTGTEWTPLFSNGEFGVLPLVAGTMVVSVIALLVAVPVGLAAAIYLSMYAKPSVRSVIKPTLEVLAGIPTVVFGYFALTFVTPQIVQRLSESTPVYNALAAGLTVGFLIIPLVSSLSEDAIQAVPRDLRDGAYALGATKLETSIRVMVPAAFSGIIASVILAFSRAVGETMVVVLAAGGIANWTWDARESMQTMTAYIAQIAGGDVPRGTIEYRTLFAVGFTLFLITLLLNIGSHFLVQKFREVYE